MATARPEYRANMSEATLASLVELDPSPIETPDEEKAENEKLPEIVQSSQPGTASGTRSPPSHVLGLSGLAGTGGHGAVYYLTRIQKYSTYAFSLFIPLHLASTSIIPLITRSIPQADNYLLLMRPYYQSPPFEELLIFAPLALHVLSGLALRIHRRNANLARYGAGHLTVKERLRRRLRVWPGFNWAQGTGYALVGLLGGHMLANRLVPLWYEGGSSGVGLAFVAHGYARHPWMAWGSQIALLGVSAAHIVWGWARWVGFLGPMDRKAAKQRRWLINGVVALFAAVWAAGGLGVVARGGAATGWIAKSYDQLYQMIPLVGGYM